MHIIKCMRKEHKKCASLNNNFTLDLPSVSYKWLSLPRLDPYVKGRPLSKDHKTRIVHQ